MSLRKMSGRALLFSAVLLIGVPLRSADAQDVDVPGNLTMHDSTDSTMGNVLKEGIPFLHNFGNSNTFLGSRAGNFTMFGSYNTAMGFQALQNNTFGGSNTATGALALASNTTGSGNTASGFDALRSNTTGNYNTASGYYALFSNTTGISNTAMGFQALQNNIFGGSNTATGTLALASNTTGSNNTASGFDALLSNANGSANTAIGRTALFSNASGNENTATGSSALFFNTTGDSNTAIGTGTLYNNSTGDGNTAIGAGANVSTGNLTNATAIGAGAVVDASNKIRLGNADVTVIEGQVPYTYTSDVNQKENFRPVGGEEVLGKIRGLSVTSWNYIGQDAKKFRHYGPIAQDLFAAFGHDAVGTIGTPTTITSGDLDGILMIAAQALEKRTAEQRKEIDSLRAENATLKGRLEALERRVGQRGRRQRESRTLGAPLSGSLRLYLSERPE